MRFDGYLRDADDEEALPDAVCGTAAARRAAASDDAEKKDCERGHASDEASGGASGR